VEDGDAYLGETLEFLDAVQRGTQAGAPLADGVRTMALLEAVGASARNGGGLVHVSP
jgi:predicted dehydrogenase